MSDDGTPAYKLVITAFFRFFIVVIIFIMLIVFYRTFINVQINTFDVESNLYIDTFLYSKSGLSYLDDKTGRLYPGTMDIDFISNPDQVEQKLNKAIDFGQKTQAAAKFTIKPFSDFLPGGGRFSGSGATGSWSNDNSGSTIQSSVISTTFPSFYYQKLWYERWEPLAKTKLSGPGGVLEKKKTYLVLLRDNEGKTFPANLEVSVLIPNS